MAETNIPPRYAQSNEALQFKLSPRQRQEFRDLDCLGQEVGKPIPYTYGKDTYHDGNGAGQKRQKEPSLDDFGAKFGPFKCRPTGKTSGKCTADF